MNAWQVIAASLGGGGLAGVIGSLITGLAQRPKVRADAVAMLTDSALKQVNELQERTAQAEREATAARNQMGKLRADIDSAMATMREWRSEILAARPEDLPRLREMVRTEPGPRVNGRRRN